MARHARARRLRSGLMTGAALMAVALTGAVSGSTPALADDGDAAESAQSAGADAAVARVDESGEIQDQPYEAVMGLDEIKARGLTGRGVTIAVIDGPLDRSVPELASADITSVETCPDFDFPAEYAAHATAVTSIIASRGFGWAPDARILHYATASEWEMGEDQEFPPDCTDSVSRAVNRAIEDGADIINVSLGSFPEESAYAFLHAVAAGVPVVLATGNDGDDDTADARTNGTIGVGAANLDGTYAEWSSWGDGLTVLAPAIDLALRGYSTYSDDEAMTAVLDLVEDDVSATSFAAPQVAGLLALGKQAHPTATGNQLVRALIDTATVPDGVTAWDPRYGYGEIDPRAFLATDPTGLEDSNPLMDKAADLPGRQALADYEDGLVDPGLLTGDTQYVYRGDDTSLAAANDGRARLCTSPRYTREGMPPACEKGIGGVLHKAGDAMSRPMAWAGLAGLAILAGLVIAGAARARRKRAGTARHLAENIDDQT